MTQFRVNVHQDEELQWYALAGHDLVQKSSLGSSLEAARDEIGGRANRGVFRDYWWENYKFGPNDPLHQARRIAIQLWGATALYGPAVAVLWAYCHPTTVTTCEGLYGNVGRLLALYPMTETGAKHKIGQSILRRRGLSRADAMRQMNSDRCEAKRGEQQKWTEMRKEAATMRESAFTAYDSARQFVRGHVKQYELLPRRDELEQGLGL